MPTFLQRIRCLLKMNSHDYCSMALQNSLKRPCEWRGKGATHIG